MPAPIEQPGYPSGEAATRDERLRRKAHRRALTKLASLYPVQFEQLVIAELAALRREQSRGEGVEA
jgi:hypothetical protein